MLLDEHYRRVVKKPTQTIPYTQNSVVIPAWNCKVWPVHMGRSTDVNERFTQTAQTSHCDHVIKEAIETAVLQ